MKMFHLPLGIRKKITLGFYLLLFFMSGSAVLTYAIVVRVEKKVELVEVIDDLLNTTLEVRRFEKNYFFYGKQEDYEENMAFWGRLEGLLFQNIKLLSSSITQVTYKDLWDMVHSYRDQMQLLHDRSGPGQDSQEAQVARTQIEEQIRLLGKDLTAIAERAARTERKAIQDLLQVTGRMLITSIVVLVIFCVVAATFITRDIVRSLRVLEEHTRKISHGQFVAAPLDVVDTEITSLLQAFNRMTIELRTRQHQLVQSEKLASLGTLLSGVAHELNNPLSNISTSAQILDEEISEADLEYKKSLIRQIMEQSDRARDIVRTLLEFSRIHAFNRQKLPLLPLVEETIKLLRGQVPSEVQIQFDIPEALTINADKQRMQQVFLNLIKNALDVLEGAGQIWVSAREVLREGKPREVEIMVEDNGPGIPAELRTKIFDPFFTTKDVGHGSGLGLYIVHDIIELHGGSIKLESRPGEGATFIIWLPDQEGETP